MIVSDEAICKECGGDVHLDRGRGEFWCIECGLVQDRAYIIAILTKKDLVRDERRGPPFGGRDAKGKRVDAETVSRLRWTSRRTSGYDKKLFDASGKIKAACTVFGWGKAVSDRATKIFEDARKILRTSHEILIASCLFAACREMNVNVKLADYVAYFFPDSDKYSRNKKMLYRYYKRVVRNTNVAPAVTKPGESIAALGSRFRDEFGANYSSVERQAYEYIRHFNAMEGQSNVRPKGLDAAAVYIAAKYHNMRVSLKMVSEVMNISPASLRRHVVKLILVIEEDWANVEEISRDDLEKDLKKRNLWELDAKTLYGIFRDAEKVAEHMKGDPKKIAEKLDMDVAWVVKLRHAIKENGLTKLYKCASWDGCSGSYGFHFSDEDAAICNLSRIDKQLRTKIGYEIDDFSDMPFLKR